MSASTGADPTGLVGAAYSGAWEAAAALCRAALPVSAALGFDGERLRGKLGCHERRPLEQPTCWIHGSSVGEVGLALRCVDALRRRRPEMRFVVTAVTREGREFARQRIAPPDHTAWFPFDAPSCVRRAFDAFVPAFVILCEVELWPNHLLEARRRGLPVFVVNGRLSERDERNYRRGGSFMRRIFALPDLVCARSAEDGERFTRLGAARVEVTGDMKFDPLPSASLRDAPTPLQVPAGALVLLGASTHPGEEAVLLNVFKSCRNEFPGLVLVLVPRHPARAPAIRREAARIGLASGTDCVVIDRVGKLPSLFARATVAFVGKSLTNRGGQNFLEAVEAGCPVVFGPHMENFAGAVEAFLAAGGVWQVQDQPDLLGSVRALLSDPARRSAMASRASALLRSRQGATGRTVSALLDRLAAPAAFTAR